MGETTHSELPKRSELIVAALSRFIQHGAVSNILSLLKKSHPADIAKAFTSCSPEERQFLWKVIPSIRIRAEMLAECELLLAKSFLEELSEEEVIRLVEQLDPDDQVYMAGLLKEDLRLRVYERIKRKSPETGRIVSAQRQTAGSIMTTQFVAIPESTTVGGALDLLRKSQEEKDVFYLYLYVIDPSQKLVGVISLGDLLRHEPSTDLIQNIMNREVYVATVDMDQEEAARLVGKYNLLALPVVNHLSEIVGIITVDDILDVIEKEAEEDILRFSGMGVGAHTHQESVTRSILQRFPWLFAASVAGMFSMWVIHTFETALSNMWYLAIFVPAINGISGNVGVQASVLVVRSINSNTIDRFRLPFFFMRQIATGSVLGVMFGCTIALITHLLFQVSEMLPFVVGTALTLSIISSTCIGTLLPFVFYGLGVDPFLAASPLVLSLVDISSISIFFTVAPWMLSLYTP